MDSVLYDYLIRNQNKERVGSSSRRNEVLAQRLSSRGYNSALNTPTIVFQNDRAGPLEGAGDVPGAVDYPHSGWIERVMTEMEKASPAKQLAVGGISGWVSGYVFGKVGRVAAIAVGGSIILLQIASYQGLVEVNWNFLERRIEATRRRFNEQTFDNLPYLVEHLRQFARRHFLLTGSFLAGFLVGIAT